MKKFLIAIVVFGLLAAGGYYGWKRFRTTVKVEPPQMVNVKRETFIHEILERGSVDSANNIDIRCEVESSGGQTIISVVPEGTVVKKGDFLVELDSSALRESVTKQQIAVLASQSKLAQSEADLKTAKLTLTEYLEGKYNEEHKTIENEIFSAQEEVRTQEDNLAFYKRLLEKGYVTDSKVAADILLLDKAIKALEIARLKLEVLDKYTKEKNVTDYTAKIASCQSKVESDKQSLKLDEERCDHLEKQVEKCRITAPQDGQVVYYMPPRGSDDDLIKEGKKVYERQILLRLPDVTQMQVKGLVNEATVRLVKEGQKATIRLEAFPNVVFDGVVKTVNDYPEPTPWMGGSMSKEYTTTISLLNVPPGIKTGLTAEARIVVNTVYDALVLPVQAVLGHGGKMYVITFQDGKWDKCEIKVGASNDTETMILDGLKEGDQVVLGAWSHRDKVDLPKIEEKDKKKDRSPNASPDQKAGEQSGEKLDGNRENRGRRDAPKQTPPQESQGEKKADETKVEPKNVEEKSNDKKTDEQPKEQPTSLE
ncbi:hemolysin D [Planctomycetales bacterium]|nr:hemolysin D [Planctomycetales bacterium]